MFVSPPSISSSKIPHKSRSFLQKLKHLLTTTPVKFNDKPVQLWKVLLPLTLLILIPLLTVTVKHASHQPTLEELSQKEYEQAKKQADTLSEKAATQADVPTDETPNVATITDVTELQDQDFFQPAQNGDKILIYEKAELIVLYRPSEDRVIATAPVLYNQPTPAIAATSSAN